MEFYVKVKSTCENCGFHGSLMRGPESPIEYYCSKTYPASKIPEEKTCSNFVYNSNLLRPLVVGDVLIKEEEE